MEFLQLVLLLIASLIIYLKPEKKRIAATCGFVACLILVVLEFYVNAWVVVPIGNF
ncbi:hypothetical protein CSPB12327_04690 [Campylobacter sp. RM12327]|uniref:hypothetical protein n=1 Tax=Campylobacter sputorum TaxID=206 RepID=UPI000B31CA67|nr:MULTISPECIES: hypothetical protein [Campylobacter]ASM40056.1 putative membrane protein [Campylobacter sputorum]MBE7358185.1 hypothetical protein [Campylobacter sp. RM11302]MBF6669439.1 hypothetical protein [Campylobacter sp. RM12327]MBF6674444.1 hypothetical protein [Campylobacter sp. RM13538]MBF6676194.1 hypothetical protein [Campylobacter sp. RM12321]